MYLWSRCIFFFTKNLMQTTLMFEGVYKIVYMHSVKPVFPFWTKAAEIIHMRLHPSSLTYTDHFWPRVKHTHMLAQGRKDLNDIAAYNTLNLTFLSKIFTSTSSSGSRQRLSSWVLNKPVSFSEEEQGE